MFACTTDQREPRRSAGGPIELLDSTAISLPSPPAVVRMAQRADGVVFLLASDGTLLRVNDTSVHAEAMMTGRLGAGPELPRAIAPSGDSVMVLLDTNRRVLHIQNLRSSTTRQLTTLPFDAFAIHTSRGGVHVAGADADSLYLLRLPLGRESERLQLARARILASEPTDPELSDHFAFFADRNTAIRLMPGDGHVFMRFPSGGEDSIYLPPRRRAGTLASDTVRAATPKAAVSLRHRLSRPHAIEVLDDSLIAIVVRDLPEGAPGQETPKGRDAIGVSWRYWLLIANLRRYQLCLDAPLPHPVDSGALFHISRTGITAHSIAPGGRQLVRHRYALDLTRCPWVGVQKGI